MVELGQTVKDVVTGFTGIVTAKVEYLNGCLQFHVRPKMSTAKKGEVPKYPDGKYLDVEQLVVVSKRKIKLQLRPKPSGGFREYPS